MWLWKPIQILCFSANGASFLAIASERSRVMPMQPSALAIWKLKSIASSVGPKGILWMWMLTPASLYIFRSSAHFARIASRCASESFGVLGPTPDRPVKDWIGPSFSSTSLSPSSTRALSVSSAVKISPR